MPGVTTCLRRRPVQVALPAHDPPLCVVIVAQAPVPVSVAAVPEAESAADAIAPEAFERRPGCLKFDIPVAPEVLLEIAAILSTKIISFDGEIAVAVV